MVTRNAAGRRRLRSSPAVWRADGVQKSGAGSPQALLHHDVPQLAQVGLGDGVVRLQLQRSQVIGFSVLQLPVEVEDGSQVH